MNRTKKGFIIKGDFSNWTYWVSVICLAAFGLTLFPGALITGVSDKSWTCIEYDTEITDKCLEYCYKTIRDFGEYPCDYNYTPGSEWIPWIIVVGIEFGIIFLISLIDVLSRVKYVNELYIMENSTEKLIKRTSCTQCWTLWENVGFGVAEAETIDEETGNNINKS